MTQDEMNEILESGKLWEEIHTLRADIKGPDGFSTWKEAAVAEKVKQVKLEKELRETKEILLLQTSELEQLRAKALHLRKTLVKIRGSDDPETLQRSVNTVLRHSYDQVVGAVMCQTLLDIREEDIK